MYFPESVSLHRKFSSLRKGECGNCQLLAKLSRSMGNLRTRFLWLASEVEGLFCCFVGRIPYLWVCANSGWHQTEL
jgi:hypothetical protein